MEYFQTIFSQLAKFDCDANGFVLRIMDVQRNVGYGKAVGACVFDDEGGACFIRRFLLPLPSDKTMDEIVINKPTLQQSRERLTMFLQQRKLRRTPERFALLERVMSQTSHFSIEDFHSRLEAEGSFHVSKATVYNTMQIFLEAGIVRRHSFNGRAQYEPVEPGGRNHHHLVCTRCGKVREIDDKNLADVVSHKRYPGFEPSYFSLYVYGLCPHCRRKK